MEYGVEDKGQRVLGDHSDRIQRTCVAESRAIAAPAVAEPTPVENHLVTILVEIRYTEVAVAVPHNRSPSRDCFASKVFPEVGNASLLNFLKVTQSETGLQCIGLFQMGVDFVAFNPLSIHLAIMKLLLEFGTVVFGRTNSFWFRMHHFLHPIGIRRTNRAIHTDDGVNHDFRFGCGFDFENQFCFATGEQTD